MLLWFAGEPGEVDLLETIGLAGTFSYQRLTEVVEGEGAGQAGGV
jgi:hypothetical protein